MYVSEICAKGILVTFPWWLKNVKSRSKIALFSNEHHFEIWFPKKKTITFFWSKLFKLHKKRPNFACGNYIFPKTRTSHGPIPHPLMSLILICFSRDSERLVKMIMNYKSFTNSMRSCLAQIVLGCSQKPLTPDASASFVLGRPLTRLDSKDITKPNGDDEVLQEFMSP